MSQGSQGSFASGRTVLPLSKFSHATVHGESITPIPWFHIGKSDNLLAVFEFLRVEESRGQVKDVKKFKVLYDPEVLEEIDLDVLASEANRARSEAQDPQMKGKLPRVTVIVKLPCIAIRYPLQGAKIRRIQIRLACNDDYFESLKLLTRANVPFGDAGTFPTQPQPARPFSSSSSHLRPSDSASQLGAQPISVSSNVGELPSVQEGAGTSWASGESARPMTSSLMGYGTPSGTISSYFGQSGQVPGVFENSRTSFYNGTVTKGLTSGVVSDYFGGQKEMPALLPTEISRPSYMRSPCRIDLYQPRPSTAPVMESQTLSQMLPPKRELPFSNPVQKQKSRKNSSRFEEDQTDSDLAVRILQPAPLISSSRLGDTAMAGVSTMEDRSELSVNSVATVPATTRKRVPASRAPRPRAPRKQIAKPPPTKVKKATEATKEKEMLPGVQQLLRETDDLPNSTEKTIDTIDTQALLSRAEAARPYRTIELPKCTQEAFRPSASAAPSSQTTKCNGCRVRKGKCNGQDPCDWCVDQDLDCTYESLAALAAQVLVPSSQPEFGAENSPEANLVADNEAAAPHQEVPTRNGTIITGPEIAERLLPTPAEPVTSELGRRDPEPPHTPQAPVLDLDATLIEAAPTEPNAETTTALHLTPAPATDPLVILLREAAFAQSASQNLTAWASLPESVQRSTLDTWMCQQLRDPGFAALLKRLDESWQANYFGRSVGIDI